MFVFNKFGGELFFGYFDIYVFFKVIYSVRKISGYLQRINGELGKEGDGKIRQEGFVEIQEEKYEERLAGGGCWISVNYLGQWLVKLVSDDSRKGR